MPRYFFDIHDGFEFRDEDGRELVDSEAVRREALKVMGELSASEGKNSDGYTIVVKVRDENGASALTLRSVFQIEDPTKSRLRIAS
ncbi:DUF6894 family protein [Methylobacterium brachythecii]|uniref:DUF6894 domain-containing protein n=1 Tax=Methylobacterium brachythecii TaxID=1176177 RepID=A0A7W6AIB2_9HYPH|nr:hypothetical protein [Methylobacterium brachythecii]MBB3903253.1 hypothetical protein [Methylobacterium brachythecii]GLS47064.1 hypothetical protein GCM10007884_50660 [Methylobacterium brachythecii]